MGCVGSPVSCGRWRLYEAQTNSLSLKLSSIIMGPIFIYTKQDVSGSLEHMETDGVCKLEEHDVHPSIQDMMVTSRQTDSTQDMANWRGML